MKPLKELEFGPPACLWMQAGVVKKKICPRGYDCAACRFDRAMNRVCLENRRAREEGREPCGRRGRFIFWKDRLRRLPLAKQPCVHHMRGHISFRACHRDFRCINCDFDQYYNDQYRVHTMVTPVEFANVRGVLLPAGYYLHRGHTWVSIEGEGEVRIGIDDFSWQILGFPDPDAMGSPLVGKAVRQGQAALIVRGKGVWAGFPSPVTGVVTAVNAELMNRPGLAHDHPYTHGWILRVFAKELRTALSNLMFMEEARAFMAGEVDRLHAFLEQAAGPGAVVRATRVSDIMGRVPEGDRERAVRSFFSGSIS
ncbi:MAG: glycine cleavage system protein H [Desulfobacteraceae bacterium]|nr:glycine cleavage system protein H [Desulfobacteraceae bacterium]